MPRMISTDLVLLRNLLKNTFKHLECFMHLLKIWLYLIFFFIH
jgi:hypothetical protein